MLTPTRPPWPWWERWWRPESINEAWKWLEQWDHEAPFP